MDPVGFVEVLWQGFQAISAGLIGLVKAFFGLFGWMVQDWMVELATIIILVLVVVKYGKFISKLLLVVLLILLASTLVHALL